MTARGGARAQREPSGARWTFLVPAALVLVAASVGAVFLVEDEVALFSSGAAVASVARWLATRSSSSPSSSESVVEPAPVGTLLALDAEAMTADELDALSPLGWHALHHLPLPHGHIDHVVAGPGGVFAIETAESKKVWKLGVPDKRLLDAVAQTKRSAAKTRSILRAGGVGIDVHPLLVFWGDAVGTADLVEGVAVVHGAEVRQWFEQRSSGAFGDGAKVESALTEFLA